MCLGNVSSIAAGQPLFDRAVRYLRRAAAIPGFYLSVHMQRYVSFIPLPLPLLDAADEMSSWLDQYGRYVK